MTETAAQREDRRRRAAEAAEMTFDFRDAVRAVRRRRAERDDGRTTRPGSTPAQIGKAERRALEAFARNNGLSMAELEGIRAVEAFRYPDGSLIRTSADCRVNVR